MKTTNSNIYFCSFADSKLSKSSNRIKKQAKKMNLFNDIFIFSEKNICEPLTIRITEIINKTNSKRGYGYWCWKPYLIKDVLTKIPEDSFLLYTDTGCHLNYKGRNKLLQYISLAKKNDIVVSKINDSNFSEKQYSKMDTILQFDYKKNDRKLEDGQIQATFLIIKNSEYSKKIISQWNDCFSPPQSHYFDDSKSINENFHEFKEHRHDQSLLSLILKKNHYASLDISHFWSNNWDDLEKNEPILFKRDKKENFAYIKKCTRCTRKLLKSVKQKCNFIHNLTIDLNVANKNNSNRFTFTNWFPADNTWKNNFICNKYLPSQKDWILNSYKPDLEYFSVFGDKEKIKKSNASKKIFFTGEDVENNFIEYSDYCLTDVDLSIGFSNNILDDKYIRYPLWLLYYFGNLTAKDEIKQAIDNFNNKKYSKNKFCSMIASHDRNGTRKQLLNIINSIQNIDCPGKLYHNDNSLQEVFSDDKIEYLRQYTFNICPENTSTDGYVTEKIFQAFDSDCIPIYYGALNNPEPEVINQNSIILFNGENGNEITNHITDLISNDTAMKEFKAQPKLLESSIDFIYKKNNLLKDKIQSLFENNKHE